MNNQVELLREHIKLYNLKELKKVVAMVKKRLTVSRLNRAQVEKIIMLYASEFARFFRLLLDKQEQKKSPEHIQISRIINKHKREKNTEKVVPVIKKATNQSNKKTLTVNFRDMFNLEEYLKKIPVGGASVYGKFLIQKTGKDKYVLSDVNTGKIFLNGSPFWAVSQYLTFKVSL